MMTQASEIMVAILFKGVACGHSFGRRFGLYVGF
jgi:hypothetical protein